MNRKAAILQSNYIPWKGYFDIINDVDVFVFYDDVQYTKNDWRNRNRVVTKNGIKWLTISVESHLSDRICDVCFKEPRWNIKQWESIKQYYAKAPFFKFYKDYFEEIYLHKKFKFLSEFNQYLIKGIAQDILKTETKFIDSRDLVVKKMEDKNKRLIEIIKKVSCNYYISGPAAKSYLDAELFEREKINLQFKDYSYYPVYRQMQEGFEHAVTVLDLIFNTGKDASYYIWGWRKKA